MVVKKRALKKVKQQVLALLHGEDLPGGAQTREIAEVPYEVPAVPRGKTTFLCANRFSSHTTKSLSTWVCTGVRNSHVVSVGRCW